MPFHRAQVAEALSELTGDRSWLQVAARAQVEAVGKGYTGAAVVRHAIARAVAARDADALQALARVLREGGVRLDPDTACALDEASATIQAECEPVSFAFKPR